MPSNSTVVKLTKTVVEGTKHDPNDRVFVWDTAVTGFGLKVYPNGSRSFVYQYRNPQGQQRMPSLGKYSQTFTVDQAREKARAWRRAVEDGKDPLGDKQAEREVPTANAVFDHYLESEEFKAKAESTKAIDRGRILRHLRPTLGKKIAKHVTKEDARKAFRQIRDGKTAKEVKTGKQGLARVTGGEGTARVALRLLKTVWRWAADPDQGLIPSNPLAGLDVGSDGERDTILEDSAQYESLFRTLDEMELQKEITRAHADAIRVVALTGARRGEVTGVQRKHVDMEKGVITLPAARHKTGKKTNEPRIISLPAAAQVLVARQPVGEPDDYVFRASKGSGRITLSSVWRKVRERAKLPEGIGLHGLRHSVATHLAMGGAQNAELMVALGHRQISTTARYIHATETARKALAERAAGMASAAMNPKPGADVIKMKRGARPR